VQKRASPVVEENANIFDDDAQVIYEYAKNINMKEYLEAFHKLGKNLKESLSGPDDKALANIEHMNILKLTDKTGEEEWYANPRDIGNVVKYKVFYAEVEYKINNLIDSYLNDGIYHHKIIIAKEDTDSSWKIFEMSGIHNKQ
jgi:hypothetical protein